MNVHGIPGVDTVLEQAPVRRLLEQVDRDVVVACIRECIASVREARQAAGGSAASPSETAGQVAAMVAERLTPQERRSLRRVINATGVIIHTNLGRSPLPRDAVEAVAEVAAAYCNVEMDLADGQRSKRELHVAGLLARLTGAEAATVVNNNAAAVLLALTALAAGQRVICSRGELVEIGGSFRMPDVIACSGATMVEVGTTNHTHLSDYEAAISDDTAVILKNHRSNFRIVGFTSEVAVADLAALAHRERATVIFDAGSGLLAPIGHPAFGHEPAIRKAVADGADIVTFSTDKLLGGPQGGAVVGRRTLIERINRHPLKRALRVGKLTLAGLEATLLAHLRQHAGETVTEHLIRRPVSELQEEAAALANAIEKTASGWVAVLEPDESSIGGGSLPGETVPTAVVWIEAPGLAPDELGAALRAADPPILGRYRRGRFGLDIRTLLPGDAEDILAAIARLAGA